MRPYFEFLGFPGLTGVDPKSYGSKLVRIDELRHGKFIWDPHRACRRRWDHFSQNTDAIRIASVFWILGFPGAHGSRGTRAPTYFSNNLRVTSRKPYRGSRKPPVSRLGGFLCLNCVRIPSELRPYLQKAQISSSWCRCRTTAPRVLLSTSRRSTPPILVARHDGHRNFCSGIGRYLWVPVEQHRLPQLVKGVLVV